jgi:hypothetical protein
MKRHPRLVSSTLGLFCTAAQLFAVGARAEDASAAETAAARSLAVDGLKLAQANNCAEAVPKLERAEKLYHSAVVSIRLGECYVGVGRLVEGTELLRKALREPQPSEPTPALTKALERAQKVLDSTKPRIAGLTVKVAAVQDMTVKVDGVVVPSALVDTEIPTDPGEHSVEVTAPGFLKSATRLSVGEAEKKSVTLTLTRDPNAALPVAPASDTAASASPNVAAAPTPEQTTAPSQSAPSERTPNRTAAYVSLGVGAAGLAVGGVLGFLTIQKHKDLKDQCPGDVCPPDQRDNYDSAKTLGNVSTVAFGVGGVGVVLGTVLFFTASPSKGDHAGRAPERRFAGLTRPRVAVGPANIVVGADF